MRSSRFERPARPIGVSHARNGDKELSTALVKDVLTDGSEDAIGVERELALHYAPAGRRAALAAVWRLDARMRRIFVGARDPTLAQIKLAWWEERLAALATDAAPAEPLLRALAPVAVDDAAAANLAAIAGGWRELNVPPWSEQEAYAHARVRGRGLIASAAQALSAEASEVQMLAGEAYALGDLAELASDQNARAMLREAAEARFASAGSAAWPRGLRPMGMIVGLSRRGLRSSRPLRHGSPARVASMAWHALTGQ